MEEMGGLLTGSDGDGSLLDTPLLSHQKPFIPGYLRLDGDRLLYRSQDPNKPRFLPREVDSRGMLEAFVQIEDAEGVKGYAERYGVLVICEHGLPASHNADAVLAELVKGERSCGGPMKVNPAETDDYSALYWEPLDRWFYYIHQAQAMLRIAVALHQNQATSQSDWETVIPPQMYDPNSWKSPTEDQARLWLSAIVSHWLDTGYVRLQFSWFPDFRYQATMLRRSDPELEFKTGPFGLLAIQLATAVCDAHKIAICSGCARIYARKGRIPQAGRRNYCPDCQTKKLPNVLHQRDKRAGRAKPNRRSKNV